MQISILGLGWLGLPLANALQQHNYSIKGSTTSEKKLEELKLKGYSVYKLLFAEEKIEGDIIQCLQESEVLILNTPPGLRRNPTSNYVAKIEKLIPYIESSTIKKVLFIGSTAVFEEGEEFPVIVNNTKPNSTSNSGVQLQQVEELLFNNPNFKTTVLRFAGLVDERRHPASMMSKRKAIPNPKAPVNLIHREDCIGVIKSILEQNQWNQVFNAAYPLHPEKEVYYTQISALKNLPKPDFNLQKPSLGKIIDGLDTSKALKYEYKHSIKDS